MDSRDGLRLSAVDEEFNKAVLDALGNPKECYKKSIIDLLCHIKKELSSGSEIIWLLKEILRSIPLGGDTCTSTGSYEAGGFVSYDYNQPVRITGINAYYIQAPDTHQGIIVDIGTQDTSGGFSLLYRLVAAHHDSGIGTADFQTRFPSPLLINPPEGERVLVHAYEVGAAVSTGVPLTVFTCIELQ